MIHHDITVMTDWALKLNSHPLPASCQWKHTHTVPAGEREEEEKRRKKEEEGERQRERERENDTYIERKELYLNMYEEKLYFLGNFRTAKILSVDIFGSVCVPFSFFLSPPPLFFFPFYPSVFSVSVSFLMAFWFWIPMVCSAYIQNRVQGLSDTLPVRSVR